MGRPKGDQRYRNEVTIIEENKEWNCNHCKRTFCGGFSRIKAHLDKIQGKGISICSVYCGNEGMHNTSSSINPQEAINTLNPLQDVCEMIDAIRGSINHQANIESTYLLGGSVAGHGVNRSSNGDGALTTFQSKLNELVSDLTREKEDIKGQIQWLESWGKKRKSDVDTRLNQLQDLKKRAVHMNNSLKVLEILDLDDELPEPNELDDLLAEKPLVLSNEFVGKEFEENVYKMWELLGDDKVFIIGIHGMGGVGKTFLATHMEKEIKRKGTFKDVFRVTVSHDFTVFKLQHHIAETIGFTLDADYEDTRATILSLELETRENSVLILDDIWKYIDLQKVGIPLKVNGIKLIMTSRLKHVCRQMDCLPHNTITMQPLFYPEDWELFLLKLGHHGIPATLPPEVLEIARSVARRCEGLPLGISVMARTMKGGNDILSWRHALNKLENLEMGEEMKEEVLTVLKRSYDNLIEKDMKKCFLYCALLPDDIDRYDLVRKLVEGGVLNGKKSLREIVDEGHIIINKLIDHSLLLLAEVDGYIGINGLVRNTACQSHSYMVKCGEGLRKIPHVREWTSDLETVSLAGNRIKEIPEGISPDCACLSTLILSDNQISHIAECFFTHMNALTVLDLSDNGTLTSLPHSLSNLRYLISLVLRGCSKLKDIPPLGELQALSRLDISYCSILQVPQGLQNLINLKWLDLSRNVNLTLVPGNVLPGLTNMQYLDLRGCSGIKVEHVQGMSMLECFGGSFLDQHNYNRYVQEIQDRGYGPTTYLIHVGKCEGWKTSYESPMYNEFERRSVRFGDCEGLPYLLPRDIKILSVRDNNKGVCLCTAPSSNNPSLEQIHIAGCGKLKSLFCFSSSCASCTNIQTLSPRGMFSHLKKFNIEGCHEIETLLTPGLVSQLQNLESISVFDCNSMKEIFAVGSGLVPQLTNLKSITVSHCNSMKEIFAVSYSGDDESFNIELPKLTKLELECLPESTTVGIGVSENIVDIHVCLVHELFS